MVSGYRFRVPRGGESAAVDGARELTFGDQRQSARPLRIVSGGQTGVDRGALDAALEAGVPAGGWCPQGRRAEDGRIPARYPLVELASADYAVRTEQNVIDSDGTLVLHRGEIRGGTRLTVQLARKHRRPCLVLDLDTQPDPAAIRRWLHESAIGVLNCAGPRESTCPGIAAQSHDLMRRVLRGES